MKDILVTGCIVTYNNAHCVGECIESILRETKETIFNYMFQTIVLRIRR